MRNITLALAVALGLVLVAASLGAAQKVEGLASSGLRQVEEARAQARGEGCLQGSVSSVAPELQLFSLREPNGEFTAFHVTPRTQITFPDGNLAALSDLHEGQRVRASYRMNEAGQYIADQVNIVGEGPARPGMRPTPSEQGMGGGWKGDQARPGAG